MTDALREFLSHEFHPPAAVAKLAGVSKGLVYAAIERDELKALKLTPRLFRVRTVDALTYFGIPYPETDTPAGKK